MPRYDVHVYAVVRVKVSGVEAEDASQAAERADQMLDLRQVESARIDGASEVEWAEDIQDYLVDAPGSACRDTYVIDKHHRQAEAVLRQSNY